MRDRSKLIKLGLIGCGRAAETLHLPALRWVPEIEVVAVADIDLNRLQRVAERFHIKRRYSNFTALLDDPVVEAIAVCVPPELHGEVALAALDAGKHLFIEKPLALSLEQCDQLIQRATCSSSITMVGFNLRWHRLVRQARTIIQQGVLWRILQELYQRGWPHHLLPRVLPTLILGLTVDAMGQMIGYIKGAGNARQKLVHFEFHRERYLSRRDREEKVSKIEQQ